MGGKRGSFATSGITLPTQKGFRELGGLFLDDVDVVDAVLPESLKKVSRVLPIRMLVKGWAFFYQIALSTRTRS